LQYDGHGSTRQLTDNNGGIVTDQVYSYDAYGVSIGYTGTKNTDLLYAGEHYDNDLSQYYLRARYYNPSNGRFNRVDPFSGNYVKQLIAFFNSKNYNFLSMWWLSS